MKSRCGVSCRLNISKLDTMKMVINVVETDLITLKSEIDELRRINESEVKPRSS